MVGFAPARRAFRDRAPERPAGAVFELLIADVAPVERQLSHGVFNDSQQSGSAHERVVRILKGFRDDQPIPPVEVIRTLVGAHQYRLHAGAHRFCCAVVAGYEAVPAIDVTDPEVRDTNFDA